MIYQPSDILIREKNGQRFITGYCLVYDKPHLVADDINQAPFMEVIRRGAATKAINGPSNILLTTDHNKHNVLATKKAGTVTFKEDHIGVYLEAPVRESTIHKDTVERIINKEYVGFSVGAYYNNQLKRNKRNDLVEITDFGNAIYEFSLVYDAAYPECEVSLREFDERFFKQDLANKNNLKLAEILL